MAYEDVIVTANGTEFPDWKEVQITAALAQATRQFDATVAEPDPEGLIESLFKAFPLLPGTEITVRATGQLIFTGVIDKYGPGADERSHDVAVSARSGGADYVDTSVDHETGYFEDETDIDIANGMNSSDAPLTTDAPPSPKIPSFMVRQGDSPFGNLMRILPDQGKTIKGAADGSLVITKPGQKRHTGGLIQGVNMERMSAILTGGDRFQTYKVKGQTSTGTKANNLRAYAEATDGNVKRPRVKIFTPYRQNDQDSLQKRAEWERNRAAGFSYKAEITSPGWRDDGGAFWEPGNLVYVESRWLKLMQDMTIERVVFTQAGPPQGTIATLSLVDPRAYNPDLSVTSKSGAEWGDWGFKSK